MKTSNLFSLNWRDFLKGLLIAVLSAVAATVQDCIKADKLEINWHHMSYVALSAGIAYLLKNLLTGPKVVTDYEH